MNGTVVQLNIHFTYNSKLISFDFSAPMAVFTLQTDYPLDNSLQTDKKSLKFENKTVFGLDGQSA